HPQPVIGGGEGSGIDPRMMHALLANWAGFLALGAMVLWLRYRLERLRQEVEEAHAMKAIAGESR
ncbi:MAG: cytochrome c biogenesis protein CcsA, partial [Terriglobales bacterium]